MGTKIPTAFVSYSHDSREHRAWVLKLATELRSKGVDVTIDAWDLQPGADLPMFMEQRLPAAD